MPECSSRYNIFEKRISHRLLEFLLHIHNYTNGLCNTLLLGDFNSRTSDNPDFTDFDSNSNFHFLPDNYTPDIVQF